MDHIPRLSEVLYVGLCHKIGTPTEVAIRRDVLDMEEMIMEPVFKHRRITVMQSGSYREGFRLRSSDRDIMFWSCNYKLISDISQFRLFNTTKHEIVLMEDSDTPPGFVKLRLLTPVRHKDTRSRPVFLNGGAYLSSRLWREQNLQYRIMERSYGENVRINGPCRSGFYGSLEFDEADCLATIFRGLNCQEVGLTDVRDTSGRRYLC